MAVGIFEDVKQEAMPDLASLRSRYPLTVTSLGSLPDREKWLKRIWTTEERWNGQFRSSASLEEAVIRGVPRADLNIEGEFDVIYAGGVTGLLHGCVMASKFERDVMVFAQESVGSAEQDWNVSAADLREFERTGIFSSAEVESAVVNRYRSAFMKFHDASSRVKTPPLWVDGVLDIALSAEVLLSLAVQKIRNSSTNSMVASGLKLIRCWVAKERAVVELEDIRTRRRKGFATKLFVDTTGPNSTVFRFLNSGRAATHVMPTVGTIAKGFARGSDSDTVDFNVGEILVSNEDAIDHRQLIWEGFAGSTQKDEYSTYLFFYDAVDSAADKSLLGLFERYFETLPQYKRKGAYWRVVKPVFGYVPGLSAQRRSSQTITAMDRVMLAGDPGGSSSPLSFCSSGRGLRTLRRFTALTNEVLAKRFLDAASLMQVSRVEPRVAHAGNFAELLRPTVKSAPFTVNETMNAVMGALHSLDGRVRRELFQDRISFSALKYLLSRTARLYPHIFQRLREHLGVKGTLWWLRDILDAAWKEGRERRENRN